jgi:hypothetical protein
MEAGQATQRERGTRLRFFCTHDRRSASVA